MVPELIWPVVLGLWLTEGEPQQIPIWNLLLFLSFLSSSWNFMQKQIWACFSSSLAMIDMKEKKNNFFLILMTGILSSQFLFDQNVVKFLSPAASLCLRVSWLGLWEVSLHELTHTLQIGHTQLALVKSLVKQPCFLNYSVNDLYLFSPLVFSPSPMEKVSN